MFLIAGRQAPRPDWLQAAASVSSGLAAAGKGIKLDAARRDLQMPIPSPRAIESARDFLKRVARIDAQQCPRCKVGPLRCVQPVAAPRWLPEPGAVVQHNRGPP